MRHRGQLQSFELHQKLHWDTNHSGRNEPPKVRSRKCFPLSDQDGNKNQAGKKEAEKHVFRNRHLTKGNFPEEKSGSPQTSGQCQQRSGPTCSVGARRLLAHTMPFRNSSSGYFVPRHTIPSFHNVSTIERSNV